jgi:hypothetical protein
MEGIIMSGGFDDLRDYFVIILIFSVFIVGISLFTSEAYTNYGLTGDSSINGTLNKSSETMVKITDMTNSLKQTELTGIGALDYLLLGAWKIVLMVFGSLDIGVSLVSEVLGVIPLPTELQIVIGVAGAIITLYIIFALLKAVTNQGGNA